MNRWTKFSIVASVGLAAGLVHAATLAMTAKEIMGKLNKGPNALTPNLKRLLQKDDPDWGEIQSEAKEYATLTVALNKANPPMGDKASWDKLTKDYADIAKALEDAVKKKDKGSALAVHTRLSRACTNCHRVHRPE
jgi:hypothetical protein